MPLSNSFGSGQGQFGLSYFGPPIYPTQMIPKITINGMDYSAHVDPTQSRIQSVLTKQVDTADLDLFDVGLSSNPVYGPNLITNGGFDVDTSAWTALYGSNASVAGGQSGKCLQLTTDANFNFTNQTFTTVPNRTYQVTFYTEGGTTYGWVWIGTVPGTGAGSRDLYSPGGAIIVGSWTLQTITFVARTTTSTIMFGAYGNGVTAYFDTVSVQEVIGAQSYGPNLLTDGDLEVWTGVNQLTNWGGSGGTDLTQETTNKYSGGYSAKLFNAGAWSYILQNFTALQAGKTYLISGWIKAGAGSSQVVVTNSSYAAQFTHITNAGVTEYFSTLYVANGTETALIAYDQTGCTTYFDTIGIQLVTTSPTLIQEWQEVIITDLVSGNRLFGGYTQQGTIASIAGGTCLDISPLHCADYSCLLDHIRVKKTYTPVNSTITDQAIIQDIFSTYCSFIDTSTYVQAVNSYPRITFSRNTLRAILDQLAASANGFWYVDYTKHLHFGLSENNPAPFGISDNLANIDLVTVFPLGNFSRNLDGTGIINRVEVVGGNYLSGNQTIYVAGTGQSNIAPLGLSLHEQTGQSQIQVWRNDGTQATPIWTAMTVMTTLNVIPTGNQVLFDFNNKTLQQSAVWPNLTNAIKIACRYEVPLDDRFTDQNSVSLYSLPCFLDGEIDNANITDKTTSKLIASGFLKGNSMGLKAYTCTVWQPGLRAGMTIPVENVAQGVSGTMLIQTVEMVLDGGGYAEFNLALGSYIPGLVDIFSKIAQNAQPLPVYNPGEVLQEMLQVTDSQSQSDTYSVTASAPPYLVGSSLKVGYFHA